VRGSRHPFTLHYEEKKKGEKEEGWKKVEYLSEMSRQAAKACTSKLHKGSRHHAEPPQSDREALLLKAEATIIGEWGPKGQRVL
jgi:hypothetical protein